MNRNIVNEVSKNNNHCLKNNCNTLFYNKINKYLIIKKIKLNNLNKNSTYVKNMKIRSKYKIIRKMKIHKFCKQSE